MSNEIRWINERISLLETQKSALQHKLDQLTGELTELQNHRANLKSQMAPIWILPNEILSYIFELGASIQGETKEAVNAYEDSDIPDIPDRPDFQVLVSHVSRRFRDVAIKTPTLWSAIHVLDLEEPRLDYIKTCLERSASLPYSVSLDCEDVHFETRYMVPNPAIDQAMTLVKANIYRLERFVARFRFFELLHQVMKYLDEPAPQLAALELFDVDYEQTFDEEMPFNPQSLREPLTLFDGCMPKLRKVLLDGVHVAWPHCNFKNLTVLCLGYHTKDVRPTYRQFQDIIENSPLLRELSLQGSAPLLSEEPAESDLYTPFLLESLEELRVSDISSDYAPALISLLHAPNLKYLVLSELDTNDYSNLLDRIAGPPALFPNLTSLKLISIEASDAAAAGLLRAYPRLEWLGLYALHGCPQWVTLLESSGNDNASIEPSEHLCPTLKCLRCIKTNLNHIQEVLSKRKQANLPLPKLELDHREDNSSYYHPSILSWLKQNVNVEFIDPSDYGSDDEDSVDGSGWISEDSNGLHFLEFSDGLDYDEEEQDDDDDIYDENDGEEESEMDISDT